MALTDNLVSYYKLDETSGATAEDSHGENDGTNNGATINQTGKIDKAYDFDGSNDFVEIADDNTLRFNNVDFTISLWLKYDTSADLEAVLVKTPAFATQQTNYGIIFAPLNKLYFIIGGDGSNTKNIKTVDSLTADTWYHVVASFTASSGTMSLIINDGTPVTEVTAVNPTANAGSLWFGKYFNTGFFDGTIDEVGIWSRALGSDEITALYNSGSGLTYPFIINIRGTIGQAAISKDYPIQSERTWETIQDLVPTEADLTLKRNQVGLR